MSNYREWEVIKRRAENISGSISIISGKSQFKGNTVNVWTCNSNDKKEIVVANTYYMGSVRQTYIINDDTTTIDWNTSTHSPKWLTKLLGPNGSNSILVKMKDMECTFEPWMYYLNCETSEKGLMFKGNIDNINTLKELKQELSKVRSIIKKYTLEQLTELSVEITKENVNRDQIVIKHNDLVRFDGRMSDHSE
jgi:hypothetical protein